MMAIVAVDVGTTHIRAARWDATGQWVQSASYPAPAMCRRGGCAEQSVEGTLSAVDRAVADVCGEDACVVALTSQRGTTILLDALDAPLTPIISWQDRRPGGIAAWFGEHAPSVVERTVRQVSIASLLVHRWTGQWVEHDATRAEATIGQTTDTATQPMTCTAGPFARGSTLVAVGGDKSCEHSGAGATWPGRCAVSFGTALSMGTLIPSNAEWTPGTYRTPSALSGFDTLEVGLPAGGVMAGPLGGPKSEVCLPPVGGVMCVPYFAGSLLDPSATGRFVGMDTTFDLDQLYAAWLESLVLELMFSRARLGTVHGPVGVCGGGVSETFAQWLSTAFQVEVLDFSGRECGLHGAALLALKSVGEPVGFLPPLTPRLVQPTSDARWLERLTRYASLVGDTLPANQDESCDL